MTGRATRSRPHDGLAVLEHWLLFIPISTSWLWRWSLRERAAKPARPQDSHHEPTQHVQTQSGGSTLMASDLEMSTTHETLRRALRRRCACQRRKKAQGVAQDAGPSGSAGRDQARPARAAAAREASAEPGSQTMNYESFFKSELDRLARRGATGSSPTSSAIAAISRMRPGATAAASARSRSGAPTTISAWASTPRC